MQPAQQQSANIALTISRGEKRSSWSVAVFDPLRRRKRLKMKEEKLRMTEG